jgi:hypothetical protein
MHYNYKALPELWMPKALLTSGTIGCCSCTAGQHSKAADLCMGVTEFLEGIVDSLQINANKACSFQIPLYRLTSLQEPCVYYYRVH